jgi:Xaa-Pro dipeptidase
MHNSGISLCVLISPPNQTYFTGFKTIYYPRPVLVLVEQPATTLVVPRCEEHEARATADVDTIVTYSEQPGVASPFSELDCLSERLQGIPDGSKVGIEIGVCPVRLADLVTSHGFPIVDIGDVAAKLRETKDAHELHHLRVAARITEMAVEASMKAITIGATEIEVDHSGNAAACAAAAQLDFAASLELFVISSSGAQRTTFPHTLSTNRRLEAGDVVSHSRQTGVSGYRAEVERTLFVGRPGAEEERVFETVRAAQLTAIEAVRPGARCSDVDRAAREVLAAAGLDAFALHRTGHGIGLATEWPYLSFDNPEVLEEGMVLTVEPGVYVRGLGGFRHSDTILVTATGREVLTSFPTDLASLTV